VGFVGATRVIDWAARVATPSGSASAIGGVGGMGWSASAKGGAASIAATALAAIGALGRTTELVVSFDGLSS
jgi:hypothetical protein